MALLAMLFIQRAAWATPTPEERQTARTMMDEGHARRDVGDHAGALAQFRGADSIMHVPTTGLEVARELVALGQLVEACDALERVLRTPVGERDPEVFRQAQRDAEVLDEELNKRLPSLRIFVRGLPDNTDAQVSIDGVIVPRPALVAPFKANPGHHVVTAAVPGSTATEQADLTEGQVTEVTLTLSPRRLSGVDIDPRRASDRWKAPSASVTPWLRWGGMGLAVAGIGVGTTTGAMSISTTNSVKKGCVNYQCPLTSRSDIDSARELATVSTVAFAAAGVGAALSVASFFMSEQAHNEPPVAPPDGTIRVHAWIGASSAGLAGSF